MDHGRAIMTYTIDRIMHAWRDCALAEWSRVVRDDDKGIPGDRDVITSYFQGVGWGWHVTGGYTERADNPWCGIGQGWCGLHLGDHLEPGQCVGVMLDPDIAKYVLPSTRRLSAERWWKKAGETMPRGDIWTPASGLIALEELLVMPRIATVITRENYGDYRDDVGGHVVLIEEYDAGEGAISTVEFNGRGELGDGTWGEGVVRRRGKHARPIGSIRRIIPFTSEHFDQLQRDPR